MVEGHEDTVITLTTAADLAAIVTRAIDYEGEWPEVGGIRGNRVTYSEIIEIGENIRGLCSHCCSYDYIVSDGVCYCRSRSSI